MNKVNRNERSNKAIIIGEGENCPKCKKPMSRKKHPPHWRNIKSYYYTEWDYCKPCGHVQHYEEYKSHEWQEVERQKSFFKSIQ